MATAYSIPPFPPDIDRDAFGHWLSGFVDGEGCFMLKIHRTRGKNKTYEMFSARFEMLLRSDDRPILELIHSFWGVGGVTDKKRLGTAKPATRYYASSTPELAAVLVPHFLQYPLRAKKRRDFEVWRQGVELLHSVWLRPSGGSTAKWLGSERAEFLRLRALLGEQRLFPAGEQD